MLIGKVVRRSLLVAAMVFMGWTSPGGAKLPDDWCDEAHCMEIEPVCDEDAIAFLCDFFCNSEIEGECEPEFCTNPGESFFRCGDPS